VTGDFLGQAWCALWAVAIIEYFSTRMFQGMHQLIRPKVSRGHGGVQGYSPLSGKVGMGAVPVKLKAFEHMGIKRRWQICQLLSYSKAEKGTNSH